MKPCGWLEGAAERARAGAGLRLRLGKGGLLSGGREWLLNDVVVDVEPRGDKYHWMNAGGRLVTAAPIDFVAPVAFLGSAVSGRPAL